MRRQRPPLRSTVPARRPPVRSAEEITACRSPDGTYEDEATRAVPPTYASAPDLAEVYGAIHDDGATCLVRDLDPRLIPIDRERDEILTRVAEPGYGVLSELPRMPAIDQATRIAHRRARDATPVDAITWCIQRSAPTRESYASAPDSVTSFAAYEEHDRKGAEEFDASLLEHYLVEEIARPDPVAFPAPAPRYFRAPHRPPANVSRTPEPRSGAIGQPRLATPPHRIPPMPIMPAPPTTSRVARSTRVERSARPVMTSPQPIQAPQAPHPQETSVDSPWTFATGAGSLHSASAAFARWPIANKLHIVAAAMLTVFAVGVLVASAIVAHSNHDRASANQPVAHVEAPAIPRQPVILSAHRASAAKKGNAPEARTRATAVAPVPATPPAGAAPSAAAHVQRAVVTAPPRPTVPATPRPIPTGKKPEGKVGTKSLEEVLSDLGDQQLGQ